MRVNFEVIVKFDECERDFIPVAILPENTCKFVCPVVVLERLELSRWWGNIHAFGWKIHRDFKIL